MFIDSPMISRSSSPSSPIMAGDSVNLTCSVNLAAGVTGTPNIQWLVSVITPTPATQIISGQEVSSFLTFSAIATSQARLYLCTATVSGSFFSTALNVMVQSKFTQTFQGVHLHSHCVYHTGGSKWR